MCIPSHALAVNDLLATIAAQKADASGARPSPLTPAMLQHLRANGHQIVRGARDAAEITEDRLQVWDTRNGAKLRQLQTSLRDLAVERRAPRDAV